MAKNTLPVNYKDDILNSTMDGKRRYRMITNSDGTVSFEDVTTYDQVGSNFGAAQLNAANTAVNASADSNKIIDDLSTIAANTQEGYMAGALAVKELNQSLTKLVQKLHPVGSWYFSTVATNPVNIFGFGTWQLVTDRFLVGAGASYFPGAMGGEAVHTLTAAELPTHQHNVLSGTLGGNNGNYKFMLSSQSMYGTYDGQYGVITDDRFITAASSAYCGNQPHNNMPPYYAIYMWVRTA